MGVFADDMTIYSNTALRLSIYIRSSGLTLLTKPPRQNCGAGFPPRLDARKIGTTAPSPSPEFVSRRGRGA